MFSHMPTVARACMRLVVSLAWWRLQFYTLLPCLAFEMRAWSFALVLFSPCVQVVGCAQLVKDPFHFHVSLSCKVLPHFMFSVKYTPEKGVS